MKPKSNYLGETAETMFGGNQTSINQSAPYPLLSLEVAQSGCGDVSALQGVSETYGDLRRQHLILWRSSLQPHVNFARQAAAMQDKGLERSVRGSQDLCLQNGSDRKVQGIEGTRKYTFEMPRFGKLLLRFLNPRKPPDISKVFQTIQKDLKLPLTGLREIGC
ncbi:hypothetical protein FHG87_019911 [Trinorchestia longiramus]|nr:hypothetical protein FHG87_019911 [Trinorchestia longiramus]